jgi:hypothetical protein
VIRLIFSGFHSGPFKKAAFFCFLSIFLFSQPSHAQTPACSVAGDAGNSYETCTSGVCERFICNGSAYVTLSSRAFAGWESTKFGNDTQTCNSARSGRLRYAGGSTWEYCNGSAWTSLSSGSSSTPAFQSGTFQTASNLTSGTYDIWTIPANTLQVNKPFQLQLSGTYFTSFSCETATMYLDWRSGGSTIFTQQYDIGFIATWVNNASYYTSISYVINMRIVPQTTTTAQFVITPSAHILLQNFPTDNYPIAKLTEYTPNATSGLKTIPNITGAMDLRIRISKNVNTYSQFDGKWVAEY